MRLTGMGIALFLVFSPPASADPAAPAGWRVSEAAGLGIYKPAADPEVELRLHAADTSSAAFGDWFDNQLKRGVSGYDAINWSAADRARPNVLMSAGMSSQASGQRVVLAIGCDSGAGTKRFGELILPPDEALIVRYAEPAATILANACADAPEQKIAVAQAPQQPAPGKPAAPVAAAKTPPVAGALEDGDIAGVLYSWDQPYTVYGLQFVEWTYLLLKDGSVRRDVPEAAPAQFDLAADRRSNPDNWGRWRRAGGKVEVNFGDGFEAPKGQMMRLQGKPGERFNGQFEASSSAVIAGASSWANWGLSLRRDGTFRRWSSGGVGGTSGFGDAAVTAGTVYDDKGASSSVGGSNVGGGSTSRTGVTDDDLEGTYHIDGWTMELRYRSGRKQRGFFFTNNDRDEIWFEGNALAIIRSR